MNNYPNIGISVCAAVLLILVSLTNVVGCQTEHPSKLTSLVEQNQGKNQLEQQRETQNSHSECDCEKNNRSTSWHFPVICTILFIPCSIGFFLYDLAGNMHLFFLLEIIEKMVSPFYQLAKILNCSWVDTPDFEYLQKIFYEQRSY